MFPLSSVHLPVIKRSFTRTDSSPVEWMSSFRSRQRTHETTDPTPLSLPPCFDDACASANSRDLVRVHRIHPAQVCQRINDVNALVNGRPTDHHRALDPIDSTDGPALWLYTTKPKIHTIAGQSIRFMYLFIFNINSPESPSQCLAPVRKSIRSRFDQPPGTGRSIITAPSHPSNPLHTSSPTSRKSPRDKRAPACPWFLPCPTTPRTMDRTFPTPSPRLSLPLLLSHHSPHAISHSLTAHFGRAVLLLPLLPRARA